MARGDQLGRQWKIIQILISSRMGKSASHLAQDLECNPRNIYRDLQALQVAGFPIYTVFTWSDPKGCSCFHDKRHCFPVMLLSIP